MEFLIYKFFLPTHSERVDDRLFVDLMKRERSYTPIPGVKLHNVMSPGSGVKCDARNTISLVPHCGEGCVWKADLIVSFGVWCIRHALELSLMESRPKLWGQYTYVLNRLRGVIDLAFFKERTPMLPCFCLQVPAAYQQKLSPVSNGSLPPTARSPRNNFTTSAMLIEIIKDVEIAISSRKGHSGTVIGDAAFPKGKENLRSAPFL